MERPTTIRGAALAAALGALTLAAGAAPMGAGPASAGPGGAAGDTHVDARFGYSIQPPKDWNATSVPLEESWLIARFVSKKAYVYNDKDGWSFEHRPDLSVIAFVSAEVRKKAEEERKARGDPEGEDPVIRVGEQFKDYLDYLGKTYTGGGYYVSKEEAVQVGDVAATAYEIKVEKLTNGPRRIVAWVFHVPDVDIAVQFEVLEDSFDKLAPTLQKALKTFKKVPREGALPTNQQRTLAGYVSRADEDQLTPDERRRRRQDHELALHKKAMEKLGEDWKHERIGRFLVLSREQGKLEKRVADHGNAAFAWLDQTFDFIGPGEYVRSPILRVCKDWNEQQSYQGGAFVLWAGLNLEIVTNRELISDTDWAFGMVGGRILDIWFEDRDRELYWAAPAWLTNGLREILSSSAPKGSKLTFKSEEWADEQLREMVRDGRAARPRDLVVTTDQEMFGEDGSSSGWDQMRQAQAFVFFLLVGEGSRDPELKAIVPNYLRNLRSIVTELEQGEAAGGGPKLSKPKTEEEEEAQLKTQRELWKKREKEILQRVFDRTFTGWDEARWKRVEKAYFRAIG